MSLAGWCIGRFKADLSNEITNLRVQLGVKDEKIRSLKESKELESENLKKEFKILANSILEENSSNNNIVSIFKM